MTTAVKALGLSQMRNMFDIDEEKSPASYGQQD